MNPLDKANFGNIESVLYSEVYQVSYIRKVSLRGSFHSCLLVFAAELSTAQREVQSRDGPIGVDQVLIWWCVVEGHVHVVHPFIFIRVGRCLERDRATEDGGWHTERMRVEWTCKLQPHTQYCGPN